jgi:hypothetical protein
MVTPIADMVRKMLAAGVPHDMIALAVATVERAATPAGARPNASAPVSTPSTRGQVDTRQEKQRRSERLKKRRYRAKLKLKKSLGASAGRPGDVSTILTVDTVDISTSSSLSLKSCSEKERSSERETRARAKPSPVDIPADWRPSPEDERFAASRGFSAAEIADVAFKFKNWFSATGERRPDWSKAWQNWVTDERRPPGRYHAIPGGKDDPLSKARQFSAADWRQKCAFVASDPSRVWPEKHWGPALGKSGCLIPASVQRELLANHLNQGLNQCTA